MVNMQAFAFEDVLYYYMIHYTKNTKMQKWIKHTDWKRFTFSQATLKLQQQGESLEF